MVVREDQVLRRASGPEMVFGGCCVSVSACLGVRLIVHRPGPAVVPLPVPSEATRAHRPSSGQWEAVFLPFPVSLTLFP